MSKSDEQPTASRVSEASPDPAPQREKSITTPRSTTSAASASPGGSISIETAPTAGTKRKSFKKVKEEQAVEHTGKPAEVSVSTTVDSEQRSPASPTQGEPKSEQSKQEACKSESPAASQPKEIAETSGSRLDVEDGEKAFLVEQLLDEQEKSRKLEEELAIQKRKLEECEQRAFFTQLREYATCPWSTEVAQWLNDSFRKIHHEGTAAVFRNACHAIVVQTAKAKKGKTISVGTLKTLVIDLLSAHDSETRYQQQKKGLPADHYPAADDKPKFEDATDSGVGVPDGLMIICQEEFETVAQIRMELLHLLLHGTVPEEYLYENPDDHKTPELSPERNTQSVQNRRLVALRPVPTSGKHRGTSHLSNKSPRPALQSIGSSMSPPPSVVFTVPSKKIRGPLVGPNNSNSGSALVQANPTQRLADGSSSTPVPRLNLAPVSSTQSNGSARGRPGARSDGGKSASPGRRNLTKSSNGNGKDGRKLDFNSNTSQQENDLEDEEDEDAEWDKLASMSYRVPSKAAQSYSLAQQRTAPTSSQPRASSALKKRKEEAENNDGVPSSARHVGFR